MLIIESCSEQLLSLSPKVVSESGFPKFLSKILPKAVVFQSNYSSMLLQSRKNCSPQLLPKAALENCYRKPRPKEAPHACHTCHACRTCRACAPAAPAAPVAPATPATIATPPTPAACRYRQMPRLSRKMKVDIVKRHAGHANSRGDNGAKRDPNAPPEPAQHYKCRICRAKYMSLFLSVPRLPSEQVVCGQVVCE